MSWWKEWLTQNKPKKLRLSINLGTMKTHLHLCQWGIQDKESTQKKLMFLMLIKKISRLLRIIQRDTRLRWVLKGMLSIKSWWLIGSSRCLCFKTKSIGWMTEKNTLNWNFSRSKRWEIKKIKSLTKSFSYNLIWLRELDSVIKIHLKKTQSKLTKTPMQKLWRCTSTWSRKVLGKMNRSSQTYRFNRRIQWCWRVTNLSHW